MRKALKNNLFRIFITLYEAHKLIKNFIEQKNYENVQNLLADCQDTAIQLGTYIEESEGEGFVTVVFLEEYCEVLYEIATTLSEGSNGHKIQEQLDKKISEAEKSARNDIKVKLEIVFMPYKASMWDSLESVWEAAKEDEDCDAYVVPIPYYDRNEDGSFGEFHYEINDYPDYVPVVHYSSYNLEQRRPDIIYIHNPYDNGNRVTSVDPMFYSTELKKYTECLVYIPYCVYEVNNIRDSMKCCHKYITLGILISDKVVLQSEEVRTAMIDMIMTLSDKNRGFWEKRIIGLGSPKYDKVLQLEGKCSDIPYTWKNLIYKADGTKKKVIFYNTSINALLKDTEQMLKKIENVINYFYEIQDEFVLIWRPHPLLKSTVESMCPNLSERYNKMVEGFIADGWGIYDDTPGYDKAFAISDGYYGDFSSLVQLYQATGKLLLIQCADITDYRKGIVTDYMYYDGQYVWFTARMFNGLFKMDATTYKVEFVGQFLDEEVEVYRLYFGIAEHNSKLYFAPYNAKSIAVYDKNKNDFHTIPLRNDIKDVKQFMCVLVFHKYIFMYGLCANSIIRIDSENETVSYINIHNNFDNNYYISSACIYNDKIYFVSLSHNSILCLNPLDMSYEYIKIDKVFDKTFNITGTNALLFRTDQGSTMYCDLEKKKMVTFDVDINNGNYSYKIKQYVCLLCEYEKSITIINIKTKQIRKVSLCFFPKWCCEVDGRLLVFSCNTGEMCLLDVERLTFKDIIYEFDSNQLPSLNSTKMFKLHQECYGRVKENISLNLENLLEGIKDNHYALKSLDGICGNKIHKYIRGEIL